MCPREPEGCMRSVPGAGATHQRGLTETCGPAWGVLCPHWGCSGEGKVRTRPSSPRQTNERPGIAPVESWRKSQASSFRASSPNHSSQVISRLPHCLSPCPLLAVTPPDLVPPARLGLQQKNHRLFWRADSELQAWLLQGSDRPYETRHPMGLGCSFPASFRPPHPVSLTVP